MPAALVTPEVLPLLGVRPVDGAAALRACRPGAQPHWPSLSPQGSARTRVATGSRARLRDPRDRPAGGPAAAGLQRADAGRRVGDQTETRRSQLRVLAALAVLALLITATGIHGLLGFTVALRDREIGVRLALGANRGSVAGMIMPEGVRIALIGVWARSPRTRRRARCARCPSACHRPIPSPSRWWCRSASSRRSRPPHARRCVRPAPSRWPRFGLTSVPHQLNQ